MPALDSSAARTSFFEYWPMRLFYTPLFLYYFWLAARHRGATLPTAANPALPHGGFIGESKSAVLDALGPRNRAVLAPYVTLSNNDQEDGLIIEAEARMRRAGLAYPIVAKPDLGCRGVGVRVISSRDDLAEYIRAFPRHADFILQELVDWPGEAGVMVVRDPASRQWSLFSMTLKYFPFVRGDGRSTLRELIESDKRAGPLSHLYLPRLSAQLDTVLGPGEVFRLTFAGNHARGAIFRDGRSCVTRAMAECFFGLAEDIPDFHFGRFDVRFQDLGELQAGRGFRIIEVNGAGAEATHIWDSRTRFTDAYRTLMRQYRYLFEIGAANRRCGHSPTPPMEFIRAWWREKRLTASYPYSH